MSNSLYYAFTISPEIEILVTLWFLKCIEHKEEDCDGTVCRDSQPGVFILIQLVFFVILHILPLS